MQISKVEIAIEDKAPVRGDESPRVNDFITRFEQRWTELEQRSEHALAGLDPKAAGLMGLQRDLSSLALETEVLTRVAEGLASSIRRIEQSQG